MSVYLRRRHREELLRRLDQPAHVQAVEGPLPAEGFAQRYGAHDTDVAAVERFAAAHGLQVTQVDKARRLVELRGTVAALTGAFRADLRCYEAHGEVFRARQGVIYVPPELGEAVTGVFGFDLRPQAKAHFRLRSPGKAVAPRAAQQTSYDPPQLVKAYQFPTGVTGAGETVGIVELGGGYRPADLQAYFSRLGITPPTVTDVSVNGGKNSPSGDPNSADGEVELDVEVVGAVAPGAKIKVFFAPNTSQGFINAISQAVHDADVTLVSISWGQAEEGYPETARTSIDGQFQDAAALGKTVFVASGDSGSADGQTDGRNHVDFPCSSPYAVACGGTTLTLTADGGVSSETVWNEQATGNGATGGGVSDFFPLPDYQKNAQVPPPQNAGQGGRGVPDVAADADPVTGYNVLIDGESAVTGGTSAVAPLYAGLFARINEALRAANRARAGFVHPVLYANGQAFRDITEGNNGAFAAGPGWDAASGLGSPIGQAILGAFQAQPAPSAGDQPLA